MQREIQFKSYEEVAREAERLRDGGYHSRGKWNLGQACAHLSYYYRGALDGFGTRMPWIIRVTFGPVIKKRYLSDKPLSPGGITAPPSDPLKAGRKEDAAAIDELIALARRLEKVADGESLHPSPVLGELSVAEWRRINLKHAAHHFSFLEPK